MRSTRQVGWRRNRVKEGERGGERREEEKYMRGGWRMWRAEGKGGERGERGKNEGGGKRVRRRTGGEGERRGSIRGGGWEEEEEEEEGVGGVKEGGE